MATSNFSVPAASGWYITIATGGAPVAHSLNGKTLTGGIQQTIRRNLTSPAQAFDGSQVTGAIITREDGIWGPATYKALTAFLRQLNFLTPNELVVLNNAAQAHRITPAVIAMALRGVRRVTLQGAEAAAQVYVPDDAVPPPYNHDPGGQFLARATSTPTSDQLRQVGMGQFDSGPQPSVATDNGSALTPADVQRTTAQTDVTPTPTPTPTGSKIPWVPIAIGAGVLVAGGVAYWVYTSKRAPE